MADDIRGWSEELARDPASLVFLQLGEALRRQGQLEVALKIAVRGLERHQHNADAHDLVARIALDQRDFARAREAWEAVLALKPSHLGALKGLGYVCYQQGRLDDAQRYLSRARESGAGDDVANALANIRRTSGGIAAPVLTETLTEPQMLFADLLVDDGQTALLLDSTGYVMAGLYLDPDGNNVAQDVGAQLSGISEEVVRSVRHLDIGEWKSITFETQVAVVAMAPAPEDTLLVVAASRATPLGLLRRLLDRCADRVADWLRSNRR